MKIYFIDLIKLYLKSVFILYRLPYRYWIKHIFNPIDMTRYFEFSYLLKIIGSMKLSFGKVLDISSPHLIDYLLPKDFDITKLNIDKNEKRFIKQSSKLRFVLGNATSLPFDDNSFNLSISISVIEHIYADYILAIQEIIRVTQPNGIIYLTFPVSYSQREEWTDDPTYSAQHQKERRHFFQYRFGKEVVDKILTEIQSSTKIITKDIYWERTDRKYDDIMQLMNKPFMKNNVLRILRNCILNLYYGLTFFNFKSKDFYATEKFGNLFLILRKK